MAAIIIRSNDAAHTNTTGGEPCRVPYSHRELLALAERYKRLPMRATLRHSHSPQVAICRRSAWHNRAMPAEIEPLAGRRHTFPHGLADLEPFGLPAGLGEPT
jgi:hypothetical protein